MAELAKANPVPTANVLNSKLPEFNCLKNPVPVPIFAAPVTVDEAVMTMSSVPCAKDIPEPAVNDLIWRSVPLNCLNTSLPAPWLVAPVTAPLALFVVLTNAC